MDEGSTRLRVQLRIALRGGLALAVLLVVLSSGSGRAGAALVYQGARGRIYIAHSDGSHRHLLTRGRYPSLSPNGRYLALFATRRPQLALIGLQPRARSHRVSRLRLIPGVSIWSANSRRLALNGADGLPLVIDAASGRVTLRLPPPPPAPPDSLDAAALSPAGTALAVVDLGFDSAFTALVRSAHDEIGLNASAYYPVWGRQGLAVAVISGDHESPEPDQLGLAQADGSVRVITHSTFDVRPDAWLPGNTVLCETGALDSLRPIIADVRTGSLRTLPGYYSNIDSASPDGRFALAERGTLLLRINLADGRTQTLARDEQYATWTTQ